jgi:small subunit ribosomal protein S20
VLESPTSHRPTPFLYQHGHCIQSQKEDRSHRLGPQARASGRQLNAANASLRSKFRTAIKAVQKAVLGGDKTKAAEQFKSAQRVIDSVADKGVFHKNKAARHKSRLAAKVKALATA